MKKFLQQGFAKKVILFALVLGLVSPSAMAYVSGVSLLGQSTFKIPPVVHNVRVAALAPVIQNLNVTATTGSATVSFSLNTASTTTVWIKDTSDTIVKTLIFDNDLTAGTVNTYPWDGTNNKNNPVASGNYKAQVVTYNTVSSDIKDFSFTYTATSVNTEVAPVVSVAVNPASIDTSLGQSTSIVYSLSTPASLSVLVKNNGSLVKTLRALSPQSAGTFPLTWDGSNAAVGTNAYTVEVYATNTKGNDTKTAVVHVTNGTTPGVTGPHITNLNVSPSPFNPNTGNTTVSFNLDKTATVNVNVLGSNNSTVKNLVNGTTLSAGSYSYQWDGRYTSTPLNPNSGVVADGYYTVNVTASNSTAYPDSQNATVQVNTGSNGGTCSLISAHSASSSRFNPEYSDVKIYYNLARSATVSAKIKYSSTTIRDLITYQLQSGSQVLSWNGMDTTGHRVVNGGYTYQITASANGCSDDVQTGYITVDGNGGGTGYDNDWPSTDENLIQNVIVRNEVFRPRNGEQTTVQFDLNHSARLIVQVLDGSNVVKTLRDVSSQSSGTYSYSWDGRDSNGNYMRDAIYSFRVMANDGSHTDTDRASTELDTDGVTIGFPSDSRCAGYSDVSLNSPFCKAIQLMSTKNIFSGYPDGTFRPYASINRAETAKVVVLALNYEVNTSGYFGKQYTDTVANAWYAPYLDVARKNNIATGYPNGTFKPASTINRVELLRVFLEANHLSLYDCDTQPFDDTPIIPATRWYMKYACYAKDNGLMSTSYSHNLFPAQAMTRGDVANLFYDFDQKGLYGYSYGNDALDNTIQTCLSYNSAGNCTQYSYNGTSGNNANRTCVARNSAGTCTSWSYDNTTCTSYSSNGSCLSYSNDNNNGSYCTSYSSNGSCLSYSNNNNNGSYCTSYNSNGVCTNYSNNSNGYYVYQNGRYVWVAY